jgi:bifunctional non-homologous end joining protein LigD
MGLPGLFAGNGWEEKAMKWQPVVPMEPVSGERIPVGGEWIAQIKWDGVRVLTYFDGRTVKLFNRKRRERTAHYPELAEIKAYCRAASVILDGEVIALAEDGKPSFHEVMKRDGLRRLDRIGQVAARVPIVYMVFDVLLADDVWLCHRPLQERLDILKDIIVPDSRVQIVASHPDGDRLFQAVKAHDMEGVVMKRLTSPYFLGEKKEWIKIKNYKDVLAVIGGVAMKDGAPNAVLLGLYDDQGRLFYIGHAGAGKLTHEEWRKLTDRLMRMKIHERPFNNKTASDRAVVWVKPAIAVKVRFAEWLKGQTLRQPVIQAVVDASPETCVFEERLMRDPDA